LWYKSGFVLKNGVTDFCQAPEDKQLLIQLSSGIQLKSVGAEHPRTQQAKTKNRQRKQAIKRKGIVREMIFRQYPNLPKMDS